MFKSLLDTPKRATGRTGARPAGKAARTPSTGAATPSGVAAPVLPVGVDDLVMRSVNLLRSQDDALREMAYLRRVSKNDIIRAAVACKMKEWDSCPDDAFTRDLKLGLIGISD